MTRIWKHRLFWPIASLLGLIVLIRTVLSLSIQIEIEGVLPWKRALLTSGASVVADEVTRAK